MTALGPVLSDADVIVCAGAGGVGKTTIAAPTGVALATGGRRVAVVTIDPARRLAMTLGVPELGNEPVRVDDAVLAEGADGELWALMLDPKRTLDELVGRVARSERIRDEILRNPIYRELSRAIAGTQEYTAVVRLCDLHRERRFDAIVLDTPPSAHARDFLDAPERITGFLESRGARALLGPAGLAGRAIGFGAGPFIAGLLRMTGTDLHSSVAAFVKLGPELIAGLEERAHEVRELLASDATRFVIVSAPSPPAVAEAASLATQLHERELAVSAGVINRVHPPVPPAVGPPSPGMSEALQARVTRTLAEARATRTRDEDAISRLGTALGDVPLAVVEHLAADVTGAEALRAIATVLV